MTFPTIDQLLPHQRPAILLARVVSEHAGTLVTEAIIDQDNPYLSNGGVGAWVGLEILAQSAGAYAGLKALRQGHPVKRGFLLGARRYRSFVPGFRLGDRLTVEVAWEFESEEGVGVARGRIMADSGKLLGEAVITVIQSPDSAL